MHSTISKELFELRPFIHGRIRRLGLGNDQDDIFQNALVRYYKARLKSGLQWAATEDAMKGLAANSVRFAVKDHFREVGRRPVTLTDVVIDVPRNDPAFEELEELNDVRQILAEHLSKELFDVFVLHHLEDQEVQEIAESLNVSRKTVWRRLKRATKILKGLPEDFMK